MTFDITRRMRPDVDEMEYTVSFTATRSAQVTVESLITGGSAMVEALVDQLTAELKAAILAELAPEPEPEQ